MYALLYRSTAACALAESDFESIRDHADGRNGLWGVTGLLLCGPAPDGERGFVQWLEGERETVHALYAHIQADARHARFEVLAEGDALETVTGGDRLFPGRHLEIRHTEALPRSLGGFLEALPDETDGPR